MKQQETNKRIVKLLAAIAIIALECMVYWFIWNRYYNRIIEFPFWRRGNWLMVALYGILLLFFNQMYGGLRVGFLRRGNLMYSQMLSVTFVNVITYLQIALLDKKFHNIGYVLGMELADAVVIVLWCLAFQKVYETLFPPRRMMLVYGERPAFHLMDKINSRDDKYILEGAMNISNGVQRILQEALKYDAVILGDVPADQRNEIVKVCYRMNIRTYIVPKISDIIIRSAVELNIFDSPLYLSRNEGLSLEQEALKRFADIILSAIALIVTSPFFLIIAVLIKLTDGGPVFYKQRRLTKDRKEFDIYKFRTMIPDAEKNCGARLASEHDPRITPVGKFLRACRMDELPQLFNILKGEMSIVGPRPERPEIAEEIEKEMPEFSYRLKVKAGLTGYAQFYGKYNTTPYDKLKLDLTYIRNYSFFLDLKLILLTPKILLLKESTEGVKPEAEEVKDSEGEA
ncbi:MAG: sugar transferase [Eubacteriales bacterium]|nr:sugar transferase [Eubacteriales bacterium]